LLAGLRVKSPWAALTAAASAILVAMDRFATFLRHWPAKLSLRRSHRP